MTIWKSIFLFETYDLVNEHLFTDNYTQSTTIFGSIIYVYSSVVNSNVSSFLRKIQVHI